MLRLTRYTTKIGRAGDREFARARDLTGTPELWVLDETADPGLDLLSNPIRCRLIVSGDVVLDLDQVLFRGCGVRDPHSGRAAARR